MNWLKNFFRNISIFFLNEKEFIEKLFPKEKIRDVLLEIVENEKKKQIAFMMDSIKKQSEFIETIESYEKDLDRDEKEIGDLVNVWDFSSASWVDDNAYLLETLSKEEIADFGPCMVYESGVEHKITANFDILNGQQVDYKQNMILSQQKTNKLFYINSLHVRLI